MFSEQSKTLLHHVLELFVQSTGIPLTMYEPDGRGELHEIYKSLGTFPQHCSALWDLDRGRGKLLCEQDMLNRALRVSKLVKREEGLCHAGLTNVTEPIIVGGQVVAVIQYGAFTDSREFDQTVRLRKHEEVMANLNASSSDATYIKDLLSRFSITKFREERVRQSLVTALTAIISEYLDQVEKEHRVRVGAFHDLQLKLQANIAHAENLYEEHSSDSTLREPLEDILAAAEASSTVMHNLMHGEYLPQEFVYERTKLKMFLDSGHKISRAEAEKKGIDFRYDLQPDDVQIAASRPHLEHAFKNLFQNAVKYSFRKSAKTSDRRYIRIRGRTRDNGYEIEISNFGIGIDPDEYEKIFKEGYRGRKTVQESRTGSGQGLALTKRIIEKHQGSIHVSSEPRGDTGDDGQGPYLTRFTIWLPFEQQE